MGKLLASAQAQRNCKEFMTYKRDNPEESEEQFQNTEEKKSFFNENMLKKQKMACDKEYKP